MSINESSSKASISQEVENTISFNFSISPPEESPSTQSVVLEKWMSPSPRWATSWPTLFVPPKIC
ncbi:hypothetical protein KY289_033948 [Solanum tuberosum]|nr:hypothetical protein KY289_033948 [Solanum tuberosum]